MNKMQRSEKFNNRIPEGTRKVFFSYYFVEANGSRTGFGNIVLAFDPTQYTDTNNMEQMIIDVQKQISITIEHTLGFKAEVQVLNWK